MFILDKPNSDEPTFIFIKKTIKGETLKYSLGKKIHPDDWDKEQKRAHPSRKDKTLQRECFELNLVLDDAEAIVQDHRSGGREKIEWHLNELLGFHNPEPEDDFWGVVSEIVADRREGRKLTRNGKVFSSKTITTYGVSIENLKLYESTTGNKLTFDIDEKGYERLLDFLNSRNLALNTIGKTVTHFKTFLYAAQARGYNVSILQKKVIKKLSEEAYDIYLPKEKIEAIYRQNTNTGYQTLAKEWFVIACFTGLRISDLTVLDKKSIIKGKITVANEKTDVRVVIPLHWTVKEILEKYKGDFPPDIPDQKINEYIKIVAEGAGLKDRVFYTITKGGKREDVTKFEYEMISTHTGRRTFITNLLKDGISESIVMKLAGIKDSRTLAKYNKISAEEVADIVAKHSSWIKGPEGSTQEGT